MTKRMLIDATHAEETRVVVLDGNRLEDFDVETSTKRQLKGNIYLAKVVRVEPSLQAAFVEYGGNRHGFLAFSEIHPDYYQIPVADRQRLLEMQAEEARREEEEEDLELALSQAATEAPQDEVAPVGEEPEPQAEPWAAAATPSLFTAKPSSGAAQEAEAGGQPEAWAQPGVPALMAEPNAQALAIEAERVTGEIVDGDDAAPVEDAEAFDADGEAIEVLPPPETVGGGDPEANDDQRERRIPPRFLRNYKIQEVIRRRQILLVQVVKEERGTKGAALTTYLSLAGRFGVLMPNSPRGGGISRKITSAADRRRLKEVMSELDIPRGMGMIVRTAGANRPKPEIKRDCEYLLRLWDDIREHTMKSVAPALIYEEASLIKRAIRDVYSRDIEEIMVDGEDGWRAAHDFMRMLMPSHAKKVQMWRDGGQPLFARHQVEAQLDAMLAPTVQLRSGGYLVINQTEALVAIDVNSGRSTRERNIEETALRTNLEAVDEVARQLRLRDLAGLIVIDLIDMESKRHNAMVERRIKEALKNDRARIQVGHISHFGLLEMSRQRLRPSLAETSFVLCPHCSGTGHVRSTESAAIHVLRGIEDEGGKKRSAEIIVHVATPVALYLLNHKRERLQEIELRYAMRVIIAADDAQITPLFRIEKVRTRSPDEAPVVVTQERSMLPPPVVEDEEEEEAVVAASDEGEDNEETADAKADGAEGGDEAERRRKRRRRRRRGGRRDDAPADAAAADGQPDEAADGDEPVEGAAAAEPVAAAAIVTTPDETVAPAESVAASETAAATAETVVTEAVAAPSEPVAAGAGKDETAEAPAGEAAGAPAAETGDAAAEEDSRNRRRGRRGGRRRKSQSEGELSPFAVPGAEQPDLLPVYSGPTPADPFGGRAFDIFDVMEQAERAAEVGKTQKAPPAAAIVNQGAPEPETRTMETTPDQTEAAAEPAAELPSAPAQPAPAAETPETPAQPEAEIVNTAAPVASGEALTTPAAPDAAPEAAAPEVPTGDTTAETAEPPPATPAIKPILVGADGEAPAERKRGWWRR